MIARDDARRVRVGVLGCADIAWRRTLPAMLAVPEIELTAMASRSAAKAARFAARFGGEPVEGYERVLADPGVDAVYLPLPVHLHSAWTERALRAGKHVLVEKPLAASAADARKVLALARDRGLVLYENFMFLHHSQHAAVRRLVSEGAIGELRNFDSAFTIPPRPPGDIRYEPGLGGGALLDIGLYPIRAAMMLIGELDVVGAVLCRDPDRGAVLSGSVLACGPGGVAVSAVFGMEHSYRTSYALSGSTGRLSTERVFTPPDGHQPVLRIERQDHREEIVLPADAQFVNVLRRFAAAVLHGEDIRAAQDEAVMQADVVEQITAVARTVYRKISA
ncbi:Gfo/Idh/MocA family oxidoreductase [Actinoplanes sp. NPDC048796]|uniref:Gfo/Idh/MocA family protein n=1 Tax=unclassified Actinoplanes TaxID=2626549 RepID=UPI003406BA3E